jgi:hypothetical protein
MISHFSNGIHQLKKKNFKSGKYFFEREFWGGVFGEKQTNVSSVLKSVYCPSSLHISI